MATAIASESASQLARLGLSEQDFKRKTELMRLYLQDNSGAASFDEFCQRQPPRIPDAVHPPQPSKPAPSDSSKNATNNTQKSQSVAPAFSAMGLPLAGAPMNAQMFGMMPTGQVREMQRIHWRFILIRHLLMHTLSPFVPPPNRSFNVTCSRCQCRYQANHSNIIPLFGSIQP